MRLKLERTTRAAITNTALTIMSEEAYTHFYIMSHRVHQDPIHKYKSYTTNVNILDYLSLLHNVNYASQWPYSILL